MKTLLVITAIIFLLINSVVALFPTETFSFVSEIGTALSQPTYLYGHEVSGAIPTWGAILCLLAPFLIVSTFVGISYAQYVAKQNAQAQKLFV